jgi:glutamate 5-kinase
VTSGDAARGAVPATAEARPRIVAANRFVVKVGSSSLTTGNQVDEGKVDALVDALAAHRLAGRDIVLVSSGAIATGMGPLGLARRPRDLATQQAAASVGQGMLMTRYTAAFARHHLTAGQVLLTADDLARRTHHRNAARTLTRLLDLGVLPVVNENDTVATDEIRFGDNDRLAALVAHLIHADALVLLSDVDGLYDGPPARDGSTLVPRVVGEQDLVGVRLGRGGELGRGGMTTKVEAAGIAAAAGVTVVLTSAPQAHAALAGEPVGTLFLPTGVRTGSRLLWLRHLSTAHGRLTLDPGAVDAVVRRRLSLLPAGITEVAGDFVAGDPVDLCDQSGHIAARGLVNYDATELPGMLGRSTRDLGRELGPAYEREVVHRDDLVLMRP